jgi:RNA polymerase sigma-70 factor (ECF subfamily)
VAPGSETGELLEHLFRQMAGRMTAHLARLLGSARLDLAEEIAQEAMLRALQIWPYQGVPENPPAWLFRTARNLALDLIRRERMVERKHQDLRPEEFAPAENLDLDSELRDDELRMILMCCHPEIPRDASVALSLKTVGGFSVREIARAFLTEEATVAQRLVRAKRHIRERGVTLDLPRGQELEARLDGALEALYFVFNEGYAAHEGEDLIRRDLCFEALRLARLIAVSSLGSPRAHALVAMMALQSARLPARVDALGDLVLLEDQDATLWDRQLIALGFHHFDLSMSGGEVSEYHVQAAIAAQHIRGGAAKDRGRAAREMDWPAILRLYDQLLEMTGSPVVALNRAVAVAKVHGPAEALAAIDPLTANPSLREYYLLLAARGHFLLELSRKEEAAASFRAALERRCSEPERRLLRRKLKECDERATAAD